MSQITPAKKRKKKVEKPSPPPKANLSKGDKVRISLDYFIATSQNQSLVEYWKSINGKTGNVVSVDDEVVWIADEDGRELMFSTDSLVEFSVE